MLAALVSICADSDDESGTPRGLLRFAGQSVAERQIDLAVDLGAERIVCLVDTIDGDVIDLQDTAKNAGVKFTAVSGARSLLGQVAASDQLIVLGDGVLPQTALVRKHLGEKPGVLVIPAEGAVEDGYERIDGEWAWAGALRASGAIVESLSQLPPDVDPISALLRIALQRGTRVIPVDGAKAARGGWLLARDEDQLAVHQQAFLRRQASLHSIFQPVRALADRLALKIAGAALDRNATGFPAMAIGIVSALGAVAAASEGMIVAAFALLTLAAFLCDIGRSLDRILSGISQKKTGRQWSAPAASGVIKVAFVALCVLSAQDGPPVDYGVLALLFLGLLRMVGQSAPSRWVEPVQDRTLMLAVIAVAASIGALKPALGIGCLAVVGLLLFVQRRKRLTPA